MGRWTTCCTTCLFHWWERTHLIETHLMHYIQRLISKMPSTMPENSRCSVDTSSYFSKWLIQSLRSWLVTKTRKNPCLLMSSVDFFPRSFFLLWQIQDEECQILTKRRKKEELFSLSLTLSQQPSLVPKVGETRIEKNSWDKHYTRHLETKMMDIGLLLTSSIICPAWEPVYSFI